MSDDWQRPRVSRIPPRLSSAGREAVELAASCGLILDPWQAFVLDGGLGERYDGKWSAFEVALIVSRQNGKGSILEARELAGLFLFGERLILHSAHEFKTAAEGFLRIEQLIDGSDDLRKQVRTITRSHGSEGIELLNGARLRFVARTRGSGRGFSGDLVILDEAYALTNASMGALLPTLSARPNPQIWYTSSAGTADSEVLTAVHARGEGDGVEPRLAYFDFSADPKASLDDRAAWRQANPAFGIRIGEEFIEGERRALSDDDFARERLGIWSHGYAASAVIPASTWAALGSPMSEVVGSVAFAVDVAPDRHSAAIAAAGMRADGLEHVEVVDYRTGDPTWIVDRLKGLQSSIDSVATLLDPSSPAGSFLPALEFAGVDVTLVTARELGQACGAFYDSAMAGTMRHLGVDAQPQLAAAWAGAKKRNLGDAWALDRKTSTDDICPAVAAVLARYGFTTHVGRPEESVW